MSRRNNARYKSHLPPTGQADRLSDTIGVDIVSFPERVKVLPNETKFLLAILGSALEEVWRTR